MAVRRTYAWLNLPPPLPAGALPQLHEAANEASLEGQQMYKRLTRARLWMAVAAAALGVAAWRVGSGQVDVLALASVVVFAIALVAEVHLGRTRPDKAWYDGRAVAESAKTLAWKYAVGADPFPVTLDQTTAAKALVNELETLKDRYPALELSPALGQQVTPWMRNTRHSSYADRQTIYIFNRLLDQQNWYRGKAKNFKKAANKWRLGLICFEVLGVLAAMVEAFTTLNLALTPLIAAVIAASIGWIQIQQYDQLAEAYSTTVSDLGSAYTKLTESAADEITWALEVNDAEEAMSREHTLWSAKRSQLY